jgi:hypothetical protein
VRMSILECAGNTVKRFPKNEGQNASGIPQTFGLLDGKRAPS